MLNTFYAPLKTCEATRQEKLRETIQRLGDQWIEPIGPNHSSYSLPSNLCSSKFDSPYRKSGCDKTGFLLLSKKLSSFAPSTYTTCTKSFWAKSLSSLQRWKTFVVFFFVPWQGSLSYPSSYLILSFIVAHSCFENWTLPLTAVRHNLRAGLAYFLMSSSIC